MPHKHLGQHWLKDRLLLETIAGFAELKPDDTVLEIGPGLGTLTSVLLSHAKEVIAVEFDSELARKLPGQFPGKRLSVYNADILSFDLTALPAGYKVVANVPYYLTSKIVQLLMTNPNKPVIAVLLVQKEVAERLAAKAGDMSILGVSAQVFADVSLGEVVPRRFFTPPPKVDSQVVIFRIRPEPLVAPEQERAFFRIVKAGFSAKRKMLRSSLSGGLGISKPDIETLLNRAQIRSDSRAEDLAISDWLTLLKLSND